MQDDFIHIVLTCDDRYVRHAAATIISIIKNSPRKFHFYVFDCGIQPENIEKLKTWNLGESIIQIIPIQKIDIFEEFDLKKCYSPAIFYRLLIPEILKDIDKAIYLDSDIIVINDLGEAWDINLDDYQIGAVPEEGNYCNRNLLLARKARLKMPLDWQYFNTGFMIFNIKQLKGINLLQQVVIFLKSNTNKAVTLPDQDALNLILERKYFFPLPEKFNQHVAQTKGKPTCLHFFWKVWLYPEFFVKHILSLKIKYAYEYFHYARQTPFANVINKEASIKAMLKCLFELMTKPIEHFFRYQVRDKVKNYIRSKNQHSC